MAEIEAGNRGAASQRRSVPLISDIFKVGERAERVTRY